MACLSAKHCCIKKLTANSAKYLDNIAIKGELAKLNAHFLNVTCAKKSHADGGIIDIPDTEFGAAVACLGKRFQFPERGEITYIGTWLKRVRSDATRTRWAWRSGRRSRKRFTLLIRKLHRASSTPSSLDLHVVAGSQPT